MPQIAKLRIVNFQYNDGRRLIADELYDFENGDRGPCNVLINLANGGGKSVLVQLMMQPIIPRAGVAGRKIESFFTRAADHFYVILEWTLDNSKMRLMTGIAMAASDEAGNSDSERGFQVKYYTFFSQYQNYQENYNIVSLPLSKRENGRYIPAAFDEVRKLARKSNGKLERYASEDRAAWRKRLKEYGIEQTEWNFIKDLNASEDGLSRYFGSLKSSDAVIDRLILPRIEEKQSQGRTETDSSLEAILISYAKQFSKQQDRIRERQLRGDFRLQLEEAETQARELWKSNDSLEECIKAVFSYSDAVGREIDRVQALAGEKEKEKAELEQRRRHIDWEKLSAAYYNCRAKLEEENERLRQAAAAKMETEKRAEEAEKHRRLLECARYACQCREIESRIEAVRGEIYSRENSARDRERLASLKYSACMAIQTELKRAAQELGQLSANKTQLRTELEKRNRELRAVQEEMEQAKTEKAKTEALLERQTNENDALVHELEIDAFRMLDGRYQAEALEAWKGAVQSREQSVVAEIKKNSGELQAAELRRDAIPQELSQAGSRLQELERRLEELGNKNEQYRRDEENMRRLLKKYGLQDETLFTERPRAYVEEKLSAAAAEMEAESRRIEEGEEALAAVERGTLHIPDLLLKHLADTAIPCRTFESYLLEQVEKGTVSKEEGIRLLKKYPFAAYAVIVTETDKERLYQETEDRQAEGKWLPAVLPVFTDSDMEKLLDYRMENFSGAAACALEYFKDRAGYEAQLQENIRGQNSRRELLRERVESLRNDRDAAAAFTDSYDRDWECRLLAEREKLVQQAEDCRGSMAALRDEQQTLKKRKILAQEEEKRLEDELRNVRKRLSDFDKKLLVGLCEEKKLSCRLCKIGKELQEYRERETELRADRDEREAETDRLEEKINELRELDRSLRKGLLTVEDAAESEQIAGRWDDLLSQYGTLLEAQNADLKALKEQETALRRQAEEKQREIQRRNCREEEYEALVYAEEAEEKAIREEKSAREHRRKAAEAYTEASRAQGIAGSDFKNAGDRLGEFGGEALPIHEVGADFENRTAAAKKQLAELAAEERALADAQTRLQRAAGRTEAAAKRYNRPDAVAAAVLEENYESQLENIEKQLSRWSSAVSANKSRLEEGLKKMADIGTVDSAAVSADITQAVGSMKGLLHSDTVQGDRYYTLCEHIRAAIRTTELQIRQIDTDLKEMDKTRDDLIHQCMLQGRQMYEGLRQLSAGSKVKVQDKRKQMLRFDIPESVDEKAAETRISAELDKGTAEIAAKMTDSSCPESEVQRIAKRIVGSSRLLRGYTGTDSILLKAYKIDRNPENSGYRTWEQTQVNNSGAEKFVIYFTVILALMAYAADEYGDSAGSRRSVLVLDNPFGPISSRHVLEPMFEISRNYRVQMICLSDISKSDIVSCFDRVIRAIVKPIAFSSREQLTHDANERIEHGFYRAEQTAMFR